MSEAQGLEEECLANAVGRIQYQIAHAARSWGAVVAGASDCERSICMWAYDVELFKALNPTNCSKGWSSGINLLISYPIPLEPYMGL